MIIKPFDELDITDPIMFGQVFSNKHITQLFIEHLLNDLTYKIFLSFAPNPLRLGNARKSVTSLALQDLLY